MFNFFFFVTLVILEGHLEIKWFINAFSDMELSKVRIQVNVRDMSKEEHVYKAIGRCSNVFSLFLPNIRLQQLTLEFPHSWEGHGQLGTEDLAVAKPVFYSQGTLSLQNYQWNSCNELIIRSSLSKISIIIPNTFLLMCLKLFEFSLLNKNKHIVNHQFMWRLKRNDC